MDEGNTRVQKSVRTEAVDKKFWHSNWFSALILILLCAAAYWNSIHGQFQYDDYSTVRFNLTFRETNLKSILLSDPTRPLSAVSLATNYKISANNPSSYHVFNIAFHFFAVFVFFLLLNRKSNNSWIALIAASFMAVHPLNTESVSYITSRPIVLCAMFYLLSLLFLDSYLQKRSLPSAIGFFVSFIFAALSKENAAIIPVAAILYVWIFYGKEGWAQSRGLLLAALGLAVAAALYRVFGFQKHPDTPGVFVYWATEVNVWIRYLWLAICPVNLNVEHDVNPLQVTNLWFIGALLLVIVIIVLCLKLRKQHPLLAFWGIWFFLNLLPTSVIPLNEYMAEHHTYLSLFGFCACLSYLLIVVCKPLARPAFLIWIVIGVLIGLYFYGTIKRNEVWKDGVTLWTDAIEKSPNRIRPHLNLASAYIEQKLFDKAISEYSIALTYNPNLTQAYNGIGIAYLRLSANRWAEQYFRKSLAIDKNDTDALVGMGLVYYGNRDCNETLKYLQRVYHLRWQSSEVVGALANCYAETGNNEEAIRIVKRCIEAGPTDGYLYAALMELYFVSKKPKESLEVYDTYHDYFSTNPRTQLQVASMLSKLGRTNQARGIAAGLAGDPSFGGLARKILASIEEKQGTK
jgi:Tfp pilus assembly protein PilF